MDIYIMNAANLDCDADKVKNFVSMLRQKKMQGIKSQEGKALSLGVELLLNYALKKQNPKAILPAEYDYMRSGKPVFTKYKGIHFSLSHSGELCACAMGDSEVGVDIQEFVSLKKGIEKKILTENELEEFKSLKEKTKNSALVKIFTIKESYLKAVGVGIALSMGNFALDEISGDGALYIRHANVYYNEIFDQRYALSVSYFGKEQPINLIQVTMKDIVTGLEVR